MSSNRPVRRTPALLIITSRRSPAAFANSETRFAISSGSVEVRVGGRTIRLGAGDLFGEMGLLSDAPRNADVIAIDYSQLFTLDKKDFQAFIGRHPDLRGRLDRIAAERDAMNRQPLAAAAHPSR